MGSVLDSSKEATATEIASDHKKEIETSEVVSDLGKETIETVSDLEKETSEAVSETKEIVSEKSEQGTIIAEKQTNEILFEEKTNEILLKKREPKVVFVLGGPGGGKSTQCAKLANEIGYTHLSSGDLMRKASETDPENGPMIKRMLKEGKSVPAGLTMQIIQKAMDESGNDKFLLDGFPRDEEIRAAFEAAAKTEPEAVLLFDCSSEERERRIMSRNQGRIDDNPESIRKRFQYFEKHTLPVVEYYFSKRKVTKIDASKPMEEVFEKLKSLLNLPGSLQPENENSEATSCQLEKDISNMKI